MRLIESVLMWRDLSADLHKSGLFFFKEKKNSFQCLIFKAGVFSTALVKVGLGVAVKAWYIPPPAAETVFTRTTSLFLSPEKLSVLTLKKAVACEYLINIVKRAGCISVLYAVRVIFG